MEYAAGAANRRLKLHRVEAREDVAWKERFDHDFVLLMAPARTAQARDDQLADADGTKVLHRHGLLARLGLDAEPSRTDGFGHAVWADLERSGSQPRAMSASCEAQKIISQKKPDSVKP